MLSMNKCLLFLLTFLIFTFADLVKPVSGPKFFCEILKETDSSITFYGENGEETIVLDSIKKFYINQKKQFMLQVVKQQWLYLYLWE